MQVLYKWGNMSDLSDTNDENVSFEINDNSSPHLSEDERKKWNVKNGKIPESCEDEQSHITEVNDENGEDDLLNSPERFRFYLDSQEWNAIKPSKKKNTKRRRLRGQWTDIFSQKFSEKNKVCVLKFTRNAVKKKCLRKTSSKFFVGKAVCKFSGCCVYDFYIKKYPGEAPRKVKVKVCRSGDIHHTRSIRRRQLKGTAREEMKKDLKSAGVSNVYYKNIASLSEIEKKAGNLTNAPSKEVLHNLRKEDSEIQLLTKDPISEVILTGEILRDGDTDSKSILGYIQCISVLPFAVVLFTEATIRLLRRALVHNIPLHLDATGSVVSKIQGQKKPVFYYALVMKDTSSVKSPIIPVAELITNSNTTVNITHFLGRVKEASIRLGSRSVRPVRIEVDFSWPLINSILLVFNAENMVKYLQKCWNTLYKTDANKDNSDYTVVHICAFHMMGIIKQKLSNIDADKKLKEFGKFCFALLQNSDCLDEATEIYASICKVMSSKVCCESVQISLTSIKNKIAVLPDKLTVEDQELPPSAMSHDEPDLSILTESSIKKSSPFEMHFKKTKNLALSEITEEGIENDYWSPEILKVFEMYMYLYPVWSGSMLKREGITRDTNADVENWFGVVKNTILQKKKNINAGLFIRKLHVQIKGRAAEFSLPMHSTKATEKNLENLEEVWRKTPQKGKGKKSKYFHSPKTIPTPRKKVRSATKTQRGKKQEGNTNDNINISARKVPLKTAEISSNIHEKMRGQNDDIESLPELSRRKSGHFEKRSPLTKNTNKKETTLTKTLERDLRAFPKDDSDLSSNVEIVSIESEDIESLLTTGIPSDCENALPKISKRKRNLFHSSQQTKKRREIPPKEFGSRPSVVIVSSESDDSNNAEQEWKPKACDFSETLPTNSKGKGFENTYHGIYNTRNNCWLNSTLQALTPFMTLFKNGM